MPSVAIMGFLAILGLRLMQEMCGEDVFYIKYTSTFLEKSSAAGQPVAPSITLQGQTPPSAEGEALGSEMNSVTGEHFFISVSVFLPQLLS